MICYHSTDVTLVNVTFCVLLFYICSPFHKLCLLAVVCICYYVIINNKIHTQNKKGYSVYMTDVNVFNIWFMHFTL